ncbi:MAG: amino acid-binding protein [Bacteroides sp.]|nr:amino acid-binding protein [Prevotella sp.]MCM1408684.1 amino acid-binding protein [Treponema brennaborense]MCM1470545.1 amino acid-binding protein [Bacteroides sp.]
MKIKQISIFLENTAGRVADVAAVLKTAGINLRALMIADTADFGILRIIPDDAEKALAVLNAAKFTTRAADVLAAAVPDTVGGLCAVMNLFREQAINIEYLYASLENKSGSAAIIFKVEDIEKGEAVIQKNGLGGADLF